MFLKYICHQAYIYIYSNISKDIYLIIFSITIHLIGTCFCFGHLGDVLLVRTTVTHSLVRLSTWSMFHGSNTQNMFLLRLQNPRLSAARAYDLRVRTEEYVWGVWTKENPNMFDMFNS